ncbi:hypothetical protein FGO68_gene8043 [Halteria grandinella]|uniref:Uncharacterized protein n=1 Tax=Halteria grandinella TaxID=5974 RepID=A0A8J8NX09_HALGN|nr:hypothetical protein FGO68_gene8043 [Halteria grandinella]
MIILLFQSGYSHLRFTQVLLFIEYLLNSHLQFLDSRIHLENFTVFVSPSFLQKVNSSNLPLPSLLSVEISSFILFGMP